MPQLGRFRATPRNVIASPVTCGSRKRVDTLVPHRSITLLKQQGIALNGPSHPGRVVPKVVQLEPHRSIPILRGPLEPVAVAGLRFTDDVAVGSIRQAIEQTSASAL